MERIAFEYRNDEPFRVVKDDCIGTIRTMEGGGVSKYIMEVKVIGQMDNTIDHTFESANRVYDVGEASPTINTCGGGGLQPKIIDNQTCVSTKGKEINVASTILAGYERTNMTGFNADNGVIEKVGQISNDGSQYGTVISEDGLCSSLMAGTHGYANNCIQNQYRIRKLTPRECWRLMDFTDEDFEKAVQVNSNTQLYKQAGNSIVKNVLVAIIGQMLSGKENIYKEN